MKDKKFLVLCGLGVVWVIMFIAMLCGAKIHPRVEMMVYAVCVGWFAYWTISSIINIFRKPPAQPTKTETNANEQDTQGSE